MKTKIKSIVPGLFLSLGIVFLSASLPYTIYAQEVKQIQYRQLSLDDYRDKVEGGWIGQAIGVLFGQYTEGRWPDSIIPFVLEDWYRPKTPPKDIADKAASIKNRNERKEFMKPFLSDKNNWEIWMPDKISDQDDLYVEYLFLYSIMKNGLDVTDREIAEDWLSYLRPDRIWGANKVAYLNFRKGIWPPMSGNPLNSKASDAIDFQIESDLFGLLSPGMPAVSNAWCDKAGHLMNYGDGVYAGMALAAMYGEAFFESDPVKLVEYSLKVIPPESGYARMINDMIALHKKYSDWQDAWKELQSTWRVRDGKPVGGLDVRINGAYVYMGLLYGNGDFWKSLDISMRCGMDSDCNPSSVAGILGTVFGMKAIPAKWAVLRNLPVENLALTGIYPNPINWDSIMNSTVEAGKWNILQNGGYLSQGIIFIPFVKPAPPVLEK